MINHQQITDVNGEKLVITVRPNTSLSRRDLVRFGWFIGLAILLVAGITTLNGIVFALYFALAEIPLVLLLLWSVWCAGFREEVITVSDREISVKKTALPLAVLPLAWTKCKFYPWHDGHSHVILLFRQAGVVVGDSLGDFERQELYRLLSANLTGKCGWH